MLAEGRDAGGTPFMAMSAEYTGIASLAQWMSVFHRTEALASKIYFFNSDSDFSSDANGLAYDDLPAKLAALGKQDLVFIDNLRYGGHGQPFTGEMIPSFLDIVDFHMQRRANPPVVTDPFHLDTGSALPSSRSRPSTAPRTGPGPIPR